MEQTQQLANQQPTQMDTIKNYILSPEVKERFSDMMGTNGIYYLNQVMILVANSDELQKCSPKSILISAMRAASLKLSVDPAQGQAWIIPYNGVATFQLGYKGVYELAQRTNYYRFINVIDVYDGEQVEENRMTGMHTLTGNRKAYDSKVIGRMLYFQLFNGFEKTFYMTSEEIEQHARRYSKAYNSPKSKWNDKFERPKMERKTVLVNGLRKWGRFNQGDLDLVNEIENAQGWLDRGSELPDESEVTHVEPEQRTVEEAMARLGYEPEKKPASGNGHKPETTQAPAPASSTPEWDETLAPAEEVYDPNNGKRGVKIGKHEYPSAWAKMLAGYTRCNVFEVDGILQQERPAGDKAPEDVVALIDYHLDHKPAK
jgi:recombination protein RecT